ncbi:hypothetical protein EON66_03730 [archaeon]|nr:MAG: hypothetical protein EON66_03730 [archaeon]
MRARTHAPAMRWCRMLASLNIPEEELKRNLLSLLNPKLKLLNKSTARRDIDVDDTFTLCLPFTSKLVRVKVPLISLASAQQVAASASASAGAGVDAGSIGSATPAGASGGGAEDVAVVAAVEESRKALLESVIVRIMKSRKHIEHNALVAEVIRMVSARFTPTPADIKRRIEHLMDRDYIERAADNHNMYSYVA